MLPDRVSNPGPLTYESGALPIALRGPLMQENQICISTLSTYLPLSIVATIRNISMILGQLIEQVSAECCMQELHFCISAFPNYLPFIHIFYSFLEQIF